MLFSFNFFLNYNDVEIFQTQKISVSVWLNTLHAAVTGKLTMIQLNCRLVIINITSPPAKL